MAIFQLPAAATSSVPNWTLLSTSTPSGVASVTFSGLSGYSKYRIVSSSIAFVSATTTSLYLTINGNTTSSNYGTNYFYSTTTPVLTTAAGTNPGITLMFINNSINATALFFKCEIDNALVLTPKSVTGFNSNNTTRFSTQIEGVVAIASAIASITIATDAGNFSTGSIYLLGAN